MKVETNNLVVVSDTHCGCKLGLIDKGGVELDEGGSYKPSRLQHKLCDMWSHFWEKAVPEATRGEPFTVIHNGDAIDGVHHNSVHQISHNLADQSEIAYQVLGPIVELCEGRYFHIRGTEAHVGKSGQEEERLAKRLGAIPNDEGQHARYDLWKWCGPKLVHFLHHIGTTGSQAYEATAVHKELVESFTEAARWNERPPSVIVRGHRHRYLKTEIATDDGHAMGVVTPGWQAKTPFTWKVAGARLAPPQFGGIVVRWAHDELFIRPKVWSIKRAKPV